MSATGGFVDKNFYVVEPGSRDVEARLIESPKGQGYRDVVKLTRGAPIVLANKDIVCPEDGEDCIDGVRVEGCEIRACLLVPGGVNGITLKGGAKDNIFSAIKFLAHGKECDIELGQFDNYWFPGRAPTRRNKFEGTSNGPVRVRLWDADGSNEFNFTGGVKITRVPKLIWFPYFLFRYAQLRVVNFLLRLRKLPEVVTA